MKKAVVLMVVLLLLSAGSALAQQRGKSASKSSGGFDVKSVYVGGGLSMNSLDGFDDAMGFQIFGGYDLPFKLGEAKTAVEVGYMDSGDFETTVSFGTLSYKVTANAAGLWVTGVVAYPVNPQLDIIGRLGYDLGDDDGIMLGVGGGYWVNKQVTIRAEYVIRDNIDSLQVNAAYHF